MKSESNSLDIDFIYGDIHGRSCKIYVYISYIYKSRSITWIQQERLIQLHSKKETQNKTIHISYGMYLHQAYAQITHLSLV